LRAALALAALPFVCAAPVAAQDAPAWSRFTSPDGAVSAEVPCTDEEVARFAFAPSDLGIPIKIGPESRVLCMRGRWLFLASALSFPAQEVGDRTAFELIKAGLVSAAGRKGEVSEFTVEGRRALVNREVTDAASADVGIIEVDRTTTIFFSTGGPTTADFDMRAAMDRFVQSIRITAQ
jgi:hypothetical protein